jgi:ribosomal protein S19E (S16A)
MDTEFERELTAEQWEALRSLRVPPREQRIVNRQVLLQLITFGLAAFRDDTPVITPKGRKVLIRGSEKLLDLAT